MKKYLTALVCLFPSKIAVFFLKILGHKVSYSSKIGFSLVLVKKLNLEKKTKIGHLNFINIDLICFKEQAYIGHLNIIKGPFSLNFEKQGAIGNSNSLIRASQGVSYGEAFLHLGELSKITAKHKIDLTRSVHLGNFTTLAGIGSQIWTHGYLHDIQGPGRFRIDGEVIIEDNIYIGSATVINAGITIKKGITIGSNSVVSKDLIESGMYVNQRLRFIEKSFEESKKELKKIEGENLVEEVYTK
jgi:acetyltransferase-like isoleucine patch superfamily enzyme|tara:strand:- start:4821 stop:5552 length:732 start_codon:yes stop_codon:yes gene_type:complete